MLEFAKRLVLLDMAVLAREALYLPTFKNIVLRSFT